MLVFLVQAAIGADQVVQAFIVSANEKKKNMMHEVKIN